jgi:hypothetical protein
MRTKAVIFMVALGVALSAMTSASAARNECAGAVETDCEYCSHDNGPLAEPGSLCDSNQPGYKWQGCAVFAAGACVVGAPPGGPAGQKCRFNSTTDVTREAGWQTGDIQAGPLVTGEGGTLKCSIHVNNNTHAGAALVTETAGAVGGVAVMEPRTLNYQATAADDVSLCTEWDGPGGPLYWRGGNAAAADLGAWSADANVACGVATTLEPNDPECSIWKAIDRRAGTNIAETWQDCEPYDEFPLPV